MTTIPDTQRAVLEAAALRPDPYAALSADLPPTPRAAVAEAVIRAGLLEHAGVARYRQLDAVLVAVRLNRITRRAHTLSQLLEEGVSLRAADMPGADELMLRAYAATAQKER